MGNAGGLARENQALGQRLSRLSEASPRINESLRSRLPAIRTLASLRRTGASLLPEPVAESQVFIDMRAGIPLLPPFQTPALRFRAGRLPYPSALICSLFSLPSIGPYC